jgi:hypothetical protein
MCAVKKETDVIKLRIDSEIKTKLEKIATSEQRTLAGQIRLVLQEWVNKRSASCAKTIGWEYPQIWSTKLRHASNVAIPGQSDFIGAPQEKSKTSK